MKYLSFLYINILLMGAVCADQKFESDNSHNQLIELYTSQGCSSCPPAQHWLSTKLQDDSLWVNTFPVIFHIDYWNYLGWTDPFSNSLFSQRQRNYHSQKAISSVYTPAFIVNGKEWRGWFLKASLPDEDTTKGLLQAQLIDNTLSVNYEYSGSHILNIALLIHDHETKVEYGENGGRVLNENFTVIDYYTQPSNSAKWTVKLNHSTLHSDYKKAIVIWINSKASLQPVQVTGGWLH